MPALINEPCHEPPRWEIPLPGADGGGSTVFLSADQLARYNADPDGYAAKYFGLSLEEYYTYVLRRYPRRDDHIIELLWWAFCSKQENKRKRARAKLEAAGLL